MKLYHRDVFWKKDFDIQSKELIDSAKELSKHMWKHIDNQNEKHEINLKELFIIVNALKHSKSVQPFEVETNNGLVDKCVVRCEYDDNFDISIVFIKDKIKTAWLNRKDDNHKTLNKEKYYTY